MFSTIQEIKEANENAGQDFFKEGVMRLFIREIESEVLKGKFFVTSERYDTFAPKQYTVRQVSDNGHVTNVSKFQEFDDKYEALESIVNNL